MATFMKQSRIKGFIVISTIYIIASAIGVIVFLVLPDIHIFWRILAADIVATIFVYLTGVILKNASVYDPYWSVAPIVIFTGTALYSHKIDPGVLLLLIATWYWGVRLTANWAYTFKNLDTQDWRYDSFKEKYPRMFQIISFFGINLFPTIVVYLCMLPGIVLIWENSWKFCFEPGGSIIGGSIFYPNIVTILGFVICLSAATIQLVADIQMHRFRHRNAGKRLIIRDGLWKHSRHPNYMGEILMWWGVYIMMLSSAPMMWFLGIGPLVNTLMFIFISIPMADKRNRRERVGFDEYVRETNMLLPIKIKKIN